VLMRLDHVSYATSHDSVIDVIQRIGSQLGASFIDGGIHPQFGTRNFVLPLKDSRYIEVVCPLDHPAADKTPFGQLVKKRVEGGGGWLAWVIAVNDLGPVEEFLGRKAVRSHRRKPNGDELYWKQIGVLNTISLASSPYFIQWESTEHPSSEESSSISLLSMEINEGAWRKNNLLVEYEKSNDVPIKWISSEGIQGIEAVTFTGVKGDVRID
jgi:hypothetical protein